MSQCKKILLEIVNLEVAGAQRMLVDLAIYYKKHGYNVLVLVLWENPHNYLSDLLQDHGIKVCYVARNQFVFKKVIERYRVITTLIHRFKPDIIHGHLDYQYLWLYALLNKRRIICTFHSQAYRLGTPLFKKLFVSLYRKKRIVPVVLTESNRTEFSKLYKVKKKDLKIIPNPIDLSQYKHRQAKCDNEVVRFCFASRFHPIKNHEMLIKAFKKVIERKGNCELVLAGEGETKKDMEQLVHYLGIERNVRFLGEVSNMPEVLSSVDVGVISSDSESFSIFLVECMAAGIPVVATKVGGMRDLLDGNGIFVDRGDTDGMAQAMIKLALNPELRKEMADRGLMNVEKFDISVVANRYLNLYERHVQ